jgi:hypothetical protein
MEDDGSGLVEEGLVEEGHPLIQASLTDVLNRLLTSCATCSRLGGMERLGGLSLPCVGTSIATSTVGRVRMRA